MPRMAPNVIRNFISPRATRRYPAEVRHSFAGVRGELVNNIESCIFCSTCARKCPSQCLSVDKHQAVWELHTAACVNCGVCSDHCPTHSLSFELKHRPASSEPVNIRLKGKIRKKKKKDQDGEKDDT